MIMYGTILLYNIVTHSGSGTEIRSGGGGGGGGAGVRGCEAADYLHKVSAYEGQELGRG